MRKCYNCQTKLNNKDLFCPHCGVENIIDENSSTKKNHTRLMVIFFTIVVILLITAIVWILKQPFAFSDNPEAIATASQSVVKLTCYDKNGDIYSTGSGFACFSDSVIVTNYHVIQDNVYSIEATTESGYSFDVEYILAYSKEKDIALLSTKKSHNLTLLQIGNCESLQKGEKIVAIGSPLGLLNSVSTGVFSGYVSESNMEILQFTASISNGSSGGALFNDKGEVLGITFASYENGQNLNLAIPIAEVQQLYNLPNDKITIAEFYNTQTPTYTVDYVLANYKNLLDKEFYIEGWVSVHSYVEDVTAWAVLFNNINDIPHNGDADKSLFGDQITVDEEMNDDFLNVIIYAETYSAMNTIKNAKTRYYVKALGHIKTEYLKWGGVSMDVTEIDIIN